MALYLLQLPGDGGQTIVDGVKLRVVEADSAAVARRVAAAQAGGDSAWSGASADTIGAGVVTDYEGFTYNVRVGPAVAGDPNSLEVTYVGIAKYTVDLIGEALASAICGQPLSAAMANDLDVAITDETVAANEDTADDMTLLPAVPAVGDNYNFGSAAPFNRLCVNVTQAGTGTYTIAWKYWNGTSWAALAGVTDDTGSFKTLGLNDVVFTVPSNWAAKQLAAEGAQYYVRAVVDAGTTTAIPLAGQAWFGPGFRSSYNSGTNVLTVAAILDGVGARKIAVTAKLPGAADGLSDLVGNIVHGGVAGAVLSVVLTPPTAIPAIMV